MLDRLKLLNQLRRIWLGKRTITPGMVVESMKALYTFITGKAALCLLTSIVVASATVSASVYKLSGGTETHNRIRQSKESSSLVEPRSGASNYSLGNTRKSPGAKSTKSSRSVAKPNKLVVVSATWCGPCKRMYPIVEKLRSEGYDAEVVYDYEGPVKITAYPTILFLRDGKVIYKNIGVTPERVLRYNLEKPAHE